GENLRQRLLRLGVVGVGLDRGPKGLEGLRPAALVDMDEARPVTVRCQLIAIRGFQPAGEAHRRKGPYASFCFRCARWIPQALGGLPIDTVRSRLIAPVHSGWISIPSVVQPALSSRASILRRQTRKPPVRGRGTATSLAHSKKDCREEAQESRKQMRI